MRDKTINGRQDNHTIKSHVKQAKYVLIPVRLSTIQLLN